jgi:hypothetical protein
MLEQKLEMIPRGSLAYMGESLEYNPYLRQHDVV